MTSTSCTSTQRPVCLLVQDEESPSRRHACRHELLGLRGHGSRAVEAALKSAREQPPADGTLHPGRLPRKHKLQELEMLRRRWERGRWGRRGRQWRRRRRRWRRVLILIATEAGGAAHALQLRQREPRRRVGSGTREDRRHNVVAKLVLVAREDGARDGAVARPAEVCHVSGRGRGAVVVLRRPNGLGGRDRGMGRRRHPEHCAIASAC